MMTRVNVRKTARETAREIAKVLHLLLLLLLLSAHAGFHMQTSSAPEFVRNLRC